MCLRPVKFNDSYVACRKCDKCHEARINNWVVRCMAERQVAGQMLAITLTYADLPSGEKPLGATVFHYKHISDLLKRIREAYFRRYKVRGEIRYLISGERGSRGSQRMHWHMLLFCDKPLGVLGEWTHFETGERHEVPTLEKNYNWTIWPHGHIKLQAPNQRGVFYVLKYAFKDHDTSEKSEGTGRHITSQTWAASMFRMSKMPPIGWRFLRDTMDRYEEKNALPPSLQFQVLDYKGYWHPVGKMREYVLQRCSVINERFREKHGANMPQYSALLSSVSVNEKNIKDREELEYGPQKWKEKSEREIKWDEQQFANDLERKARGAASAATIKRCGGILPCKRCNSLWTDAQRAELEGDFTRRYREWRSRVARQEDTKEDFEKWWLSLARPSRGCKERNSEPVFAAFRDARAARLAGKRRNKKTTIATFEPEGRNSPGDGRPLHRHDQSGGSTKEQLQKATRQSDGTKR